LTYKNIGTFEESGEITLFLDPLVSYKEAVPPPSSIAADKLVWTYDALRPLTGDKIDLLLGMPDELSTGAVIQLTAEMAAANGVLAEYDYTPTVICSYDPNDKLVMPVDSTGDNIIQQEQELTYTIRFQNEGNAEAINIFIEDTLDTSLDMVSFRVIDSSFPVLTSINNNVVRFDFENIWLPAASVDEIGSQGYVTYRIMPNPNLEPGSKIENEAFIYFDFNAPIQTNKTVNTIFISTSNENIEALSEIIVRPNPANNSIHVESELDIQKIEIYSLNGLLIDQETAPNLDVSELKSGLYLIKVKTKEGIFSQLISVFH